MILALAGCGEERAAGRYQLGTNPVVVLDTETGALWRVAGDAGSGYALEPVPYTVNGEVSETPPEPPR